MISESSEKMTWFRKIADPQSLTRSRILGDLFQEKTDHIFARKANQQVYKRLVYFSEKPFNVHKTNPTAKRKSLRGFLLLISLINHPPPQTYPPQKQLGLNSPALFIKGNRTSQVSMDVGPLSAAGWCLSPDHPVKLSHFWWVTSWSPTVGEFWETLKKWIWKKEIRLLFLGGNPIFFGVGGGWVGYIWSVDEV